ncbi:MAG: SsrA-binding protein SmpB [Chloroflexi bacterium]|nr:SsrA-binding protein SmpB [Chloroflexota bacterium]
MSNVAIQTIAVNRKALHDYHILDTVEAGLVLTGTEIKSIRAGRANLREAYAALDKGEMWLFNMHVAHYEAASRFNHEPTRQRKLLLHKKELWSFGGRAEEQGLTLVPLRLYLKNGLAKVEIGLAKGKRVYDKRETIARREAERQIQRALRREKL